jgi:hypothetical protein
VTNDKEFLELHNLETEERVWVEALLDASNRNCILKNGVHFTRWVNAWEQVAEETEKDNLILLNNLGNVEVAQGSAEKSLLGKIWLSSLERTSNDKN